MPTKPCGVLTQQTELLQFFRLPYAEMTSVSLGIATYDRLTSRAIRIALYEVPDHIPDAAMDVGMFKKTIRHTTPLASFGRTMWSDNDSVLLHTDPRKMKRGRAYAIHVAAEGVGSDPAITTWLNADGGRIEGHVATFYGGQHQGAYGLRAQLHAVDPVVEAPVPQAILYSPVTQCNLNCIHCIARETRTKKSVMNASIKDSIRDWCARGLVSQIASDYSGDILWADKKFGGEIDFLDSLGVPIHIDTNGVHLDETMSRRLMGINLHSLNVSLDAATTETFIRVRKGAPPLEEVTANIAGFIAARRAADAVDRIRVSLSFTLMRSTIDELDAFIRMAAALGVGLVHARHLEAYTENMGPNSMIFDRAKLTTALTRAKALADDLGVELATADLPASYTAGRHGRCEVAWGSALIMGNGDVAVCCVPRMTIGNLHENSMEEIWNGPHYQEFRRRVNSDSPPAQCAACPIMRDWHNVNSYLPFLTMPSWEHPRDWVLA